jgi:hypothetical protein
VSGTPVTPAVPTVLVSGISGPLETTYGTASAEQSFTVSGSALSGNLTVAAPAALEVSTTPGGGFGGSLVLTAAGGAVANTTVYVRLRSTAAAGAYNNPSISITGGGDDTTVATGRPVRLGAGGETAAAASGPAADTVGSGWDSSGIRNRVPHSGQMPLRPARSSLTLRRCPWGQ